MVAIPYIKNGYISPQKIFKITQQFVLVNDIQQFEFLCLFIHIYDYIHIYIHVEKINKQTKKKFKFISWATNIPNQFTTLFQWIVLNNVGQ